MTNTAFFDVARQQAFAAMAGDAPPVLRGKLLTHLKITGKFFSGDEVVTVDEGSAQIVILPKNSAQGLASLIDTSAVFTGEGDNAQYVFEWDLADSVQLRAALDSQADPTKPVELRYQLIYSMGGEAATIGGPIYFENNFFRPETPAPEATLNTSWETLKERLVAGGNILFAADNEAKTITISAIGGVGGGADWGDIGGDLADQADLALALAAKLSAADASATYQVKITDGALTIARTSGLQAALDAKLSSAAAAATYQAIITDGALTIARTSGLQAALDAKLSSAAAAATYQAIITDGALTIARTSGLQAALDAKLSSTAAAAAYQPLSSALTTYAGISPTANVQALLGAADYAAMRTLLGLLIGTNVQAWNAKLDTLATGFGIFQGAMIWNGTTFALSTTLATANGGTGQGFYLTGDLLYGSSPTLAVLAGNTTTAKKWLSQTGTGPVSAAPVWSSLPAEIIIACSDESTDLTTGTAKATFRMPHAMTLTSVRLSVNTAPTGSVIIVDVKEAGTTIFSTKPQIATSAKTSVGGAVPGTISDTSLADDAEITINIDQIGSTIAGKGLKVTLIGTR